jgi:diguanylate cyclase (GGDEF)-like protein
MNDKYLLTYELDNPQERNHVHVFDLTDIYNRRMWMEHANHALRVAKRYEDHLSLIVVDIDYDFKVVNDTRGHQKGDRVLQVLAAALKEQSRGSDVVGRYGGEEFVVLCPKPF